MSPANTKDQLLHIGTGSATVATIRTGTGIATAMELVSGGFKINGTFESTGNATVGGTLSVTGAATLTGTLTLGGVEVKPSQWKVVTSDVSCSSNTVGVAISDLDFTPVNGATYEVEMSLIAKAVTTGTGVQLVNTSGTGTLVLVSNDSAAYISATGGTFAATTSAAGGTPFGMVIKGIFTATSTAVLTWELLSEANGNQVDILAGSMMRITRIS